MPISFPVGRGLRIGTIALVCVHGPLRKLAGNRAELQIGGATVEELLRGLERKHPSTAATMRSSGSG